MPFPPLGAIYFLLVKLMLLLKLNDLTALPELSFTVTLPEHVAFRVAVLPEALAKVGEILKLEIAAVNPDCVVETE